MPQTLIVVEHPVLADRVSVLRSRDTPHGEFRQALYEAAAIMAVEVARELPVKEVDIETPLESTRGQRLRDEVAVVPVLRAGLGMVEGFLRLLPDPRVGALGIKRDEKDHKPVKRAGAKHLELVCLVSAPEGINAVEQAHPDVRIWTAAVDRELDENAYIRPGLGDAGDRVFGTA